MRHLHGMKIKLDLVQFMEIIIIVITAIFVCYNPYAEHRNRHLNICEYKLRVVFRPMCEFY
jgi:hypothetical protein